MDTKSTTMLSGTAHVILHVRLAGGGARQIRLHNEGVWTMGGKKRASDELAARINEWAGGGGREKNVAISQLNPNSGGRGASVRNVYYCVFVS